MLRRRHRSLRRAAWLALAALFLQIVVPVLHHPASAAPVPGDRTLAANLCLAPGTLPPAHSGDKAPLHRAPPCPVCQTLHMLGGGFVPPAGFALDPDLIQIRASDPIPAVAVLDGRAVSAARARAPPLKA